MLLISPFARVHAVSNAEGRIVASLQNADRPPQAWTSGGTEALPLEAPALGLDAGWQTRLLAETGTYASMVRRNLGAGSPLNLPPGPNALVVQGGPLIPPVGE